MIAMHRPASLSSKIISRVAEEYGFRPATLSKRVGSKTPRLVRARDACMAALQEEAGLSLPQIGKAFGGFHHTSVMAAIRRQRGLAPKTRDGNHVSLRDQVFDLTARLEALESMLREFGAGLA